MSIYEELAQIAATGKSAALCTITGSQGSTPRNMGSKMLVYPDGSISGSIGGGEMEGRVIEAALEILETRPEAWCPACRRAVPVRERFDPCPDCNGFELQLSGGDELRIKELEVE